MSTAWQSEPRVGSGYEYDDATFTYDQVLEPEEGSSVRYDEAGVLTAWTNQSKP